MDSVKKYASITKAVLKGIIESSVEAGYEQPHLLILEYMSNDTNSSYINTKELKKDCATIGIKVTCHNVKHAEKLTTKQAVDILLVLQELNDFDAVVIQKPIPKNIEIDELKQAIRTIQDVDGFIDDDLYTPCAPKGVMDYLDYCNYSFEGQTACVVGRSKTIGKPLADMLLKKNCTVTVCHSKTSEDDLRAYIQDSDIVFTCTNKIEQFDYTYFGANSDVIDFGLGVGEDNKLYGNIKADSVKILIEVNKDTNDHIVISGTELLTRVALMENTVKAAYGWGTGKVGDKNEQDSKN